MSALFLTGLEHGTAYQLAPRSLRHGAGMVQTEYDEKWLQDCLFRHPELIVLDRMEPGAGDVVPICTEFPIPRAAGTVFLDMLGVTKTGRIVLIECKLWRNPQARREVIAQIIEYAALIRLMSYGDLTARLKQRLQGSGQNPLFALARQQWPDLHEAHFVDGVSRSLALGDFHLIIAGDGIRSDVQSVSAHLNGAGLARLSLLELSIWESSSLAGVVIVPSVPLRTEVLQQRVVVSQSGQPLQLEEQPTEDSVENAIDPASVERRAINRAFWQRFIEGVTFDHPEQPAARHGGDNWVKVPLPEPFGWFTVFRASGAKPIVGVFISLKNDDGEALYEQLTENLDTLREESGLDLIVKPPRINPFSGEIGVYRARSDLALDEAQLAWLSETANRFATMLRLQLAVTREPAE